MSQYSSQYSNEQLMAAFKMLPNDVQEAILNVNTAEIIKQTAEKYRLLIDKAGELADETGLVMMGLTHPNQFIANLAERLGVDKVIAKEIAEEINTRIFFPVRENLKKIYQIEAGTLISEPEIKTGQYEPFPPVQPSPAFTFAAPEMPIGTDLTEPFDSAQGKAAEEMPVPPPTPAPEPEISKLNPSTPPFDNAQGKLGASIFEEKTKEEIFRSPMEVSEKNLETPEKPAVPPPPPEPPKSDPYREPIPEIRK